MGVAWKGAVYADGMLPFGLRSAPKIFTAVADALEWILRERGVAFVDHYLDDFITWGPPGSNVCSENLARILSTCNELGVLVAAEKVEGPTSRLTFLGIEVDTRSGVLRLPDEKLVRLRTTLSQWSLCKTCRRRELESLVGSLQHACRVVKPGRAFLRQIIDLLRLPSATKGHHHIRLNRDFRADLQWWCIFAEHWNGVAALPQQGSPAFGVTSDASGNWGCGAWSGNSWLQFAWPSLARDHHIAFKELFAGLLAFAVWGERWRRKRVQWYCDNQAAVIAVMNRSCRDRSLMHLVRCLFFLEAWYEFELTASYLPGVENSLADDLSRNRLSRFLSQANTPDAAPASVPPGLPDLLLDIQGWISPTWTRRFSSIVIRV